MTNRSPLDDHPTARHPHPTQHQPVRPPRPLAARLALLLVILLFVPVLNACSSEEDREAERRQQIRAEQRTIAADTIEAAYARDYTTLWALASVSLSFHYQNNTVVFEENVEETLAFAGVPTGEFRVDSVEGPSSHPSYPDDPRIKNYTVYGTDPDGYTTAVDVLVKPDDHDTQRFCTAFLADRYTIGDYGTC